MMYPLYNQHLAEQHMQTLRREATVMRSMNSINGTLSAHQEKVRLVNLWYVMLGLSMPEYSASSTKLTQAVAYDWWQQRAKMLMRIIGLIAFAFGALIGSVLDSVAGLVLPLLLVGAVTLVVSLPMVVRLLLSMRVYIGGLMAHR